MCKNSFLEKPIIKIIINQTFVFAMTRFAVFDAVVGGATVPVLLPADGVDIAVDVLVDIAVDNSSSILLTGCCCFFLINPNNFLAIFRNMEHVKQ